MCLLAVLYRRVAEAPVLVAANREEYFDRPFSSPEVHRDQRRFLAGLDLRAGGTWLGANECGLVVAVTNRPKNDPPLVPRSRGLLCRELLSCANAAAAADVARAALRDNRYAGANFVVADAADGTIFEAGDELIETPLEPGLHLVTNGAADNPHDSRQQLARELFEAAPITSAETFLSAARRVCRHGPDASDRTIVVRLPDRGTVSSTLIALTTDPAAAAYYFADGAPDVTSYVDYSRTLRELLGWANPQPAEYR